jgi:hypothetical protein
MPLGIGSAVWLANVLPFAYFLWYLLFGLRRNQILAMNFGGQNTRYNYKRWWIRMFFGSAQYTFYALDICYKIAKWKAQSEDHSYPEFTAFYHDIDLYDAEKSDKARKVFDKYLNTNRLNETRDVVLKKFYLLW